jgi:hypothetical protein
MNNLFISYDLNAPGQDYPALIDAIKALGNWAKVQKSLWYVKSTYSASDAVEKVWPKMDRNDSLIVIDATNKTAAWQGVDDKVSEYLKGHWVK